MDDAARILWQPTHHFFTPAVPASIFEDTPNCAVEGRPNGKGKAKEVVVNQSLTPNYIDIDSD